MRSIIVVATLAAALAQAGVASAGCMATVGLAPPPDGVQPGQVWTAEITVLQHGVNPLPNAKSARPTLTIVNEKSGERTTFVATPTKDPAVFTAHVVFPSAGRWSYEVFDDFTSADGQAVPCARTHTFQAVAVGGPAGGGGDPAPPQASPQPAVAASSGDGFPVWPVAGAVLGVLLAAAGSALLLRRRRADRGPGVAVG
ncbi:MAG TPA: hypothetical protein VD704_08380 [Gaiellaceae bacterium]|nr:hypothetical protein [Gaiellaceae bacterium]